MKAKQKKSKTSIRESRKQPVSKKTLLIVVLASLITLACLSVAGLFAFWAFVRSEAIAVFESTGENGYSLPPTAKPARFILATSESDEPLPLLGVPSVTPFSLPEPKDTLLPTPTSTLVVVATPTSTSTPIPTPTPEATATSLPVDTPAPLPTDTPVPAEIKHVVIISIDGMRPDAWEQANTPNLDTLRTKGAYYSSARSVQPSETMPNHSSMLSGMVPDKHGIFWNILYAEAPRINGPTLFSVSHDAGLSTAMIAGKPKLEYLVVPGSVDNFIGGEFTDVDVKNQAVALIQAGLPNILFIHLPDVDRVGHASGWMSPEQLQALAITDGFVGEIVAAIEAGGYLNSTLLIITTDHGGSGKGHQAPDKPENSIVPWLALGPNVPINVTLTGPINIYDTAATAAYALKLTIPEQWDGRPVMEIFID